MEPEPIVQFLGRRGMRTARTASCWWYNEYRQERVYQAFPLHRLVSPSPQEVGEVFRRFPKAVAVRFLGPADGPGYGSVLWTRRRPYDLGCLHPKSRNQTRRGLEKSEVRPLAWGELVERGWEAHRDTAARHGRPAPDSLGFDAGLAECPAYEAWGAFVGGHLAAYLVTLWVEDWVHILLQRSASAYLKHSPNNALVYTVAREMFARPGVSTLTYGLDGLALRASLDHFKENMGFEREPVRQRFVVRPWLRPCFNRLTCQVVEGVSRLPWLRASRRFDKIAGFCRAVRQSR